MQNLQTHVFFQNLRTQGLSLENSPNSDSIEKNLSLKNSSNSGSKSPNSFVPEKMNWRKKTNSEAQRFSRSPMSRSKLIFFWKPWTRKKTQRLRLSPVWVQKVVRVSREQNFATRKQLYGSQVGRESSPISVAKIYKHICGLQDCIAVVFANEKNYQNCQNSSEFVFGEYPKLIKFKHVFFSENNDADNKTPYLL